MTINRNRKLYLVPNVSETRAASAEATPLHRCRGAVREIEWFFTLYECDMGVHSNYMESLLPAQHREHHDKTLERRVTARTARRVILRSLEAIGRSHAGVLQVAYETRPWCAELQDELGPLTGIAVRIATAKVGMPDDDRELDLLERRTAEQLADTLVHLGAPGILDLRREAAARYHSALRAYERERGDVILPIGRWR